MALKHLLIAVVALLSVIALVQQPVQAQDSVEDRLAAVESFIARQTDLEHLRHFFMNWMYKEDDVANNAIKRDELETIIQNDFLDDVVMDLEQFGRYEGKEHMKDWVTWVEGIPWHRHHINHMTVDITGDNNDQALIRCTAMRHANFLQSGGGPELAPFWHSKIIKWDLVKVEGAWKVKFIYQHSDFVTSFDGPGWFQYAYPPGLEPLKAAAEGDEEVKAGKEL
jgi:hypothetical protein